MSLGALVLSAGRGERLGNHLPKGFVAVGGVPMLARALSRLLSVEQVSFVCPVIPDAEQARFEALRATLPDAGPRLGPPVVGGARRQDSVAAGLAALPEEVSLVAVHDAARCLVDAGDIERVVALAREHGAAILAAPVADTIKRVRGGVVLATPPRAEVRAAQTPQVFRADWLREAHAKASSEGFSGTDDAELVERLGVRVHVVEARHPNPKITFAQDLAWAQAHLAAGPEAT